MTKNKKLFGSEALKLLFFYAKNNQIAKYGDLIRSNSPKARVCGVLMCSITPKANRKKNKNVE